MSTFSLRLNAKVYLKEFRKKTKKNFRQTHLNIAKLQHEFEKQLVVIDSIYELPMIV